ncbi:MAG: hypothetical protein M3O03_03620 [Pseudomonadota bacterium]|nr:hypothetical protein [Pseudomonadota bacterium]
MKKLLLAGLAVSALGFAAMTPADARDGCGVHRYRADNGRCYWMRSYNQDYQGYNYGPSIGFGFYGGGPFGWNNQGWGRDWHGYHHHWHH